MNVESVEERGRMMDASHRKPVENISVSPQLGLMSMLLLLNDFLAAIAFPSSW